MNNTGGSSMARSRRSSGKKIDVLRWVGFDTSTTAFGFAAGTIGVTVLAAGASPETVMRTRGNLSAFIDGVEAPATSATISVGLHIVPEGTGTTVLTSPFTDAEADWFYHREFLIAYEEYVVDVISSQWMSGFSLAQ